MDAVNSPLMPWGLVPVRPPTAGHGETTRSRHYGLRRVGRGRAKNAAGTWRHQGVPNRRRRRPWPGGQGQKGARAPGNRAGHQLFEGRIFLRKHLARRAPKNDEHVIAAYLGVPDEEVATVEKEVGR